MSRDTHHCEARSLQATVAEEGERD